MLFRRSVPLTVFASSLASVALLHCGTADPSDFGVDSASSSGGSSSGPILGGGDGSTVPSQEAGGGTCGDKTLALEEECDDGNLVNGDGCSTTCKLEAGYVCPTVGLVCEAAVCGDGILAGAEECEPTDGGAGCSATCTIEPGYDCDPATFTCTTVVCGDGKIQRGETCEDGNALPFDGCYQCKTEPACSNGVCQATCGDGQRFGSEACDDGNLHDGDGCSSTCAVETGFACTDVTGNPPTAIPLPILARDFIGVGNEVNGGVAHPNFNGLPGSQTAGIVMPDLGADGKPHLVCPGKGPTEACTNNPGYSHVAGDGRHIVSDQAHFDQWYANGVAVNLPVVKTVSLALQDNGTYVWNSLDRAQNEQKAWFDPIGSGGFVAAGKEQQVACPDDPAVGQGGTRNVSFTSETHFFFEYAGGETFAFSGDDDTWVFLNGKLAVDLGGLHTPLDGSFTLGADGNATSSDLRGASVPGSFGLTIGGVYEVVMFQAERNQCGSNFKVTLKDFNRPKSTCESRCGDGVVASDEVCDDGTNDGSYGGCAAGCKARGPRCGDGVVDPSKEQCDDGNSDNHDGCTNGCTAAVVN